MERASSAPPTMTRPRKEEEWYVTNATNILPGTRWEPSARFYSLLLSDSLGRAKVGSGTTFIALYPTYNFILRKLGPTSGVKLWQMVHSVATVL